MRFYRSSHHRHIGIAWPICYPTKVNLPWSCFHSQRQSHHTGQHLFHKELRYCLLRYYLHCESTCPIDSTYSLYRMLDERKFFHFCLYNCSLKTVSRLLSCMDHIDKFWACPFGHCCQHYCSLRCLPLSCHCLRHNPRKFRSYKSHRLSPCRSTTSSFDRQTKFRRPLNKSPSLHSHTQDSGTIKRNHNHYQSWNRRLRTVCNSCLQDRQSWALGQQNWFERAWTRLPRRAIPPPRRWRRGP